MKRHFNSSDHNKKEKMTNELIVLLPKSVTSRDGISFDPSEELSILSDATIEAARIDWNTFATLVTTKFIYHLKSTLIWYLKNKSLSHSLNLFKHAKNYFTAILTTHLGVSFSSESLISYRSTLPKYKEWQLAALSGFIRKFQSLGFPGVDGDVLELLDQFHLAQNPKGAAVQTMDTHRGPFTDIELQAIEEITGAALIDRAIDLQTYAQVALTKALGSRSVQLASLKLGDLNLPSAGNPTYTLNMPRGKQRNGFRRGEFKSRSLVKELGDILHLLAEEVADRYRSFDEQPLVDADLPFFPTWCQENAPGFAHHSTSRQLGHRMTQAMRKLRVSTERGSGFLHVTSRRFRYTVGTRAAEEGHGTLILAELLDHSDTQSVGVYISATSKVTARIDKAVAFKLAPLAQAFSGKLLSDRTTAVRFSDPSSAISHPNLGGDLGGCGHFGFCAAAAPIACYTCRNFEAWVEAPHEIVLDFLISEKTRVLGLTGDERIASVNDRSILAVAHVIHLIRLRSPSASDNPDSQRRDDTEEVAA